MSTWMIARVIVPLSLFHGGASGCRALTPIRNCGLHARQWGTHGERCSVAETLAFHGPS